MRSRLGQVPTGSLLPLLAWLPRLLVLSMLLVPLLLVNRQVDSVLREPPLLEKQQTLSM